MRTSMAEPQKRSGSLTPQHNHPHPIRIATPAQPMYPPSGNTGTTRGPPSPSSSSSSSSSESSTSSTFRFNAVSEERRQLLSRNWRYREWARHGQLNVPVELPEEEEHAPTQKQVDEGKSKKPEPPEESDEPPGFRWVTIEIV